MITIIEWGNWVPFCQEADLPVCHLWSASLNRTCTPLGLVIQDRTYTQFGDMILCALAVLLSLVLCRKAFIKRAAVGRIELIIFLIFYMAQTLLQLLTSPGLLAPSSSIYQLLNSSQIGLVVAAFWVLFWNGMVGHQFIMDGSLVSVGLISLTGCILGAVVSFLCMDVYSNITDFFTIAPSDYQSPTLFIMYLIWPLVATLGYLIWMTVLVVRQLGDHRPLMYLYFAALMFAASQIFMFVLNTMICEGTKQSVDGRLFSTLGYLSAVLLMFRFWDSITEDEWDNMDDIFV